MGMAGEDGPGVARIKQRRGGHVRKWWGPPQVSLQTGHWSRGLRSYGGAMVSR